MLRMTAFAFCFLVNSLKSEYFHKDVKGLHLFTIVRFLNAPCQISGGQVGTCYNIKECYLRQGLPQDTCAFGYGVCCLFLRTCGGTITQNCTYFTNPGFPGPFDGSQTCTVQVQRILAPQICQLRLQFVDFKLNNPVEGVCNTDMFTVTGQNSNSMIPALCGSNSGQHMYVDVDRAGSLVNLNVLTSGSGERRWNIKVSQIPCNSPCRAPTNCLQYYKGPTGNFQSFNYDATNPLSVSGGYLRNLNYAICFRTEANHCSIEYRVQDNSVFAIFNVDSSNNPTIEGDEAGLGVQECPNDYILLGGIRYCGTRLNPSMDSPNPTENSPVLDTSNGPFIARFMSDAVENAQGYNLVYRQIPCNST